MPKVTKTGNSLGVIINRTLLSIANIKEGDNVVVSVDAKKRIIITKAV